MQTGYSLLELLIVIFLASISVGILSFSSLQPSLHDSAKAVKLVGLIASSQQRAISRRENLKLIYNSGYWQETHSKKRLLIPVSSVSSSQKNEITFYASGSVSPASIMLNEDCKISISIYGKTTKVC